MRKKNLLIASFLAITFTWLLTTIFVDIFTVPTVFRTLTNRDEAGLLGIALFTRFNYLEIILGVCAFAMSFTMFKKNIVRALCILFIIYPLSYSFYLSPKIKELNLARMNAVDTVEIEKDLAFYHSIYVKLDSIKMLLLLGMVGVSGRLLYKEED